MPSDKKRRPFFLNLSLCFQFVDIDFFNTQHWIIHHHHQSFSNKLICVQYILTYKSSWIYFPKIVLEWFLQHKIIDWRWRRLTNLTQTYEKSLQTTSNFSIHFNFWIQFEVSIICTHAYKYWFFSAYLPVKPKLFEIASSLEMERPSNGAK